MKKLVLFLAIIVLICGLTACGKKEGEQSSEGPVSIVETEKNTSKNTNKPKNTYIGQDDLDPYTANIPNEIIDFYIEKINEIEQENKDLLTKQIEENPDFDLSRAIKYKYDLVFIDDNNTPELVADYDGFRIELYTYDAGKVMNALGDNESWPYGAGGNAGYEYAPKKNVISNVNSDFAGMIRYYSFYELDKDHKVVPIYKDDIYVLHFEDKDGDKMPAEDEEYLDEPAHYYRGTKSISKKDFDKLMIEGDYEPLSGTKSASEILKLLNGLVNVK